MCPLTVVLSHIFFNLTTLFSYSVFFSLFHAPPEGRPGMSDVSPLFGISGLSFDSTGVVCHQLGLLGTDLHAVD